MKIQSMVLCLLMAVPAFAQTTQIDPGQVDNYRIAVRQGGSDALTCVNGSLFTQWEEQQNSYFWNANRGTVNTDGTQPVVTLSYLNPNGAYAYDFAFTTSSDYKKVLKIDVIYQEKMMVNEGNIIAPSVVEKMVPKLLDTCR